MHIPWLRVSSLVDKTFLLPAAPQDNKWTLGCTLEPSVPIFVVEDSGFAAPKPEDALVIAK
jgi:hypothetical protein